MADAALSAFMDDSDTKDASPPLATDPHIDSYLKDAPPPPPKQSRQSRQSIEDLANDNFEATNSTVRRMVKATAGSVLGGYAGLTSLLKGEGIDKAADAVNDLQSRFAEAPSGERERQQQDVLDSKKNPLNWPALAGSKLGELEGRLGGGPLLQTAVDVGTQALPMALGMRKPTPAALETAAPAALPAPAPRVPGTAPVPKRIPASVPIDVKATDAPADAARVNYSPDAPFVDKGAKLPADEQMRRANVLNRIGVQETRKSALTGDAQAAADEYQSSRLNTPAGQHLSNVIDHERNALETHADNIVHDTGGTPGSAKDQTVTTRRGENFLQPIDALKDRFDDVRKQMYATADERAKGQPIELPGVQNFIASNRSAFVGSTAGTQLLRGLKTRIGELGMSGEDGALSGTAQQAEHLRQYLNDQWEPGPKSRLIGKLKDSIDTDVTKSAGDDIYSSARQWRTLQARTLEDPKGIAQLLDASGPAGINRAVPVEKVMDKLTTMPVAQLRHIVNTLDSISDPAIRPMADKAVAELNAHMASKIADQGKSTSSLWNHKGVNDYLNSNAERLKLTMPSELQDNLRDLNDAGQILKKRQEYPGAFIQESNIVRSGLANAVRHGAGVAGAAAGHGLASMVTGPAASLMGGKVAGGIESAGALKAAQARTVRLRDFRAE